MITLLPVTFFNSPYFDAVIDEREIPDKISLTENQPRNRDKIVLVIESIIVEKFIKFRFR